MKISDILAAAAADVEAAGVPEDLRSAAFTKAIELRTGEFPSTSQPAGVRQEAPVEGPLLEAARRLRVDPAVLVEVVEIDESGVEIIAAPSRFPKQRAAGTRDVALIIAAVRQAAGLDDGWTESEVIREQCRRMGVFDSANFATELGRMSDVFGFKGTGRGRVIRVNLRGFEQAGLRIVDIAGGA